MGQVLGRGPGVTPLECTIESHRAVSRLGGGFMVAPQVTMRAAELGLTFFDFYLAGRAGVLGTHAAPEQVTASLALLEPGTVRASWARARAQVDPLLASQAYARCAVEWSACLESRGRERLAALTTRVVAALDPATTTPLVAGWQRLVAEAAANTDSAGVCVLALNTLREFRGAVHGAAVLAVGLHPVEAIVAGPDGAERAGLLGWPVPYPDPAPFAARRAEAEALTDTGAAAAFETLDPDERAEFCSIVVASESRFRARNT
jgi:hypothetical protein